MKCCTCGADFETKVEPNIYYCENCGAVWLISPGEEADGEAVLQSLKGSAKEES